MEELQFCSRSHFRIHTTEKEPEHATPDFRFNGIKLFICCFFMKAKDDCKMDSFTEGCIVCGIMTFAEMIYRIAVAHSEICKTSGMLRHTNNVSQCASTLVDHR